VSIDLQASLLTPRIVFVFIGPNEGEGQGWGQECFFHISNPLGLSEGDMDLGVSISLKELLLLRAISVVDVVPSYLYWLQREIGCIEPGLATRVGERPNQAII